jgi:hypothetical protein
MSGWYNTGNKNHDATCTAAEGVRQVASAPWASAATIKAADIAFHRSVIAFAQANNLPIPTTSLTALRELGVSS